MNNIKESLEVLIKNGNQPLLDSVALGSFLNHDLKMSKSDTKSFITDVMNNNPTLTAVLDTCLGRIGLITLPVLYEEIYLDDNLVQYVEQAVTLAESLGAKCVSLTDLIPSATNYAKAINTKEDENVLLSTGHGVTVAAMVLRMANRDTALETVAFVGLGSIGLSTLELMLSVLKHPKKLILCDIYNKQQMLHDIHERIINHYHYKGEVVIAIPTALELPSIIYQEASMIIGATNIPNIIETPKLKPGTVIVDDSYPHIFDVDSCLIRVQEKKDIIVIHGGILTLPEPISITFDHRFNSYFDAVKSRYEHEIMGCIVGSILPLIDKRILPTIGIVKSEIATSYYSALKENGIKSSSLQCESYHYTSDIIENFSQITIHPV
jgi:predicted amino acid dehydrogenase